MASAIERPELKRAEGDFLLLLRDDVFNVDYLSFYRNLTDEIRHGLTDVIQRNWPQVIRERYRDYIDLSRELLEEGRSIVVDVLRPASYGDDNISLAVNLVESGEDPLKIQQVLDRVEGPYLIAGVDFKREILATAYMVAAFKAERHMQKPLSKLMLDAGIPLLAQAIAARRQAALK